MKNCLENLLHHRAIPVVNENDAVAITALVFTDNGELAGLVASQLGVDAVVILAGVRGVVVGDFRDPTAPIVEKIDLATSSTFKKFVTNDCSVSGHGGMHTKFRIAGRLAAQG